MAKKQVENNDFDAKSIIDKYEEFGVKYINLVTKNKATLDERNELMRQVNKLNAKLATHDKKLAELKQEYDADGFMTEERYKILDSRVVAKKSVNREDKRKVLLDALSKIKTDIIQFTQVKKIIADATNTNGPNDKKVLQKQIGVPEDAWVQPEGKRSSHIKREQLIHFLEQGDHS